MQMHALEFAAGTALIVGMSSVATAQTTTDDVRRKLDSPGYTQVHDIHFGPEATTAKATKDGKGWSLIIDPSGKAIRVSE